jgi:uncharacterized ion transporter superfamily protein YfcC
MRLRLPHPFVLLLAAVGVAAALTWLIPAGRYQRRTDAASGRSLVVAGTYATVPSTPVGPAAAVMAVPRGIVEGADIILTVIIVGGAFAMLDALGVFQRLVGALVGRTRRPRLVVISVSLTFALLGALDNTHEEVVALVPVLVVLSRGLGFGPITALAMSVGSAVVGAAYGPTNPFQTGIALRFAELPPLTMPALRFGLLAATVAVWIGWTLFMARRDPAIADEGLSVPAAEIPRASGRDLLLLALLLVPFVPYVIGVLRFDWGFNTLSALFLVAGFAVGLLAGQGWSGTADGFLRGMSVMLPAALFIGVARAISLVLTDGAVIDTVVNGLAAPLSQLPSSVAVLLMIPMHALLHIPVSSVSGHAVLTMPIMAPLADLLHVSRDAAVIAYQAGAGLMDAMTPTNGALLAMLLGANVRYGRWLRFAIPGMLMVAAVGAVGVLIAA